MTKEAFADCEAHAILDAITDAEQAAESHSYLYSPIALEMIRARHKKARQQLTQLIERVRAQKGIPMPTPPTTRSTDFVLIENLTNLEIRDEPLFTVAVILDETRLEDTDGNGEVSSYHEARKLAEDWATRLGLTIREAKAE